MGRDEWDDQEDFERYAEWELEAPAFPPRSQLYALEPVGVGTPEVECLTSYLTRLAGEHHVLTGDLLGNVLTPRFDKPSWVRHGSPNLGTLYSGAGALNGIGSQAGEWVEALEDVTQRTDVQALTLLIWAEVLPAKELLRSTRAWCPVCYQEWRIQGQVIYEPLLWALGVVTACARHRRRLQVQCPMPACRRSIPWLASHARPGYCPSCQEWLGEAKTHRPTKQERLSEEETAWQSWIAQGVGELLAHNAALSMAPPRERITKTLLACIQQITNGKKTTFARLLGFNWDQFRAWTRGTAIPVFPELLQLCYRLGTTPLAFLTAEEVVIDLHRIVRPAEPEWLTRELRPPRKRLHPEKLRQDLQTIITAQENPPPSLRKVAEQLGHSVPALRRHCPDLCEALVRRYTEYIQAEMQQRLEARAQEIKEAALSLQSAGVYPSQERVAAQLARPALFLDPEARDVWQQVLEELGFSR
jgi:AraC-like DNA-binding protein